MASAMCLNGFLEVWDLAATVIVGCFQTFQWKRNVCWQVNVNLTS